MQHAPKDGRRAATAGTKFGESPVCTHDDLCVVPPLQAGLRNVLVITTINSKPLPATEGPYALRSLSDTRSGPFHVKWLNRIEVFTVLKQALLQG